MNRRLESPATIQEIYFARGSDVPEYRPLSTGDILARAGPIAEDDSAVAAMIVTHPCSMRTDGVALRDRLLVVPVRPHREMHLNDWRGSYGIMPLPDPFCEGDHYAAHFEDMVPVASADLDRTTRRACLGPRGVNLLLQRLVMHMTRVIVETSAFNDACAGVFSELEIVEDWCAEGLEAGIDADTCVTACHEWLREAPGGVMRQDLLKDDQLSPNVRRASDRDVQAWIASLTS